MTVQSSKNGLEVDRNRQDKERNIIHKGKGDPKLVSRKRIMVKVISKEPGKTNRNYFLKKKKKKKQKLRAQKCRWKFRDKPKQYGARTNKPPHAKKSREGSIR